jgi:uncharacterized protein (DUF2236 family)
MADVSVGVRVTAERLLLLGWSRAILMQFAHPLVAAGVYEHSGFRKSPAAALSRLHHTVGAMLSLAFGDEHEATTTLDGIRFIHTRVNGVLPMRVGAYAAGTPYSAEDPSLVLWVHATLVDSMVIAYERFVAPLTADERDAYCDEAAWVAVALGAVPEQVPRTWMAVRAYLNSMLSGSDIVVGPQARELAVALLWPSVAVALPGSGPINRLLTSVLMPPRLRYEFGLVWSPARRAAAERISNLIRATRRVAPEVIAHWAAARHLHRSLRA